MKDVVTRPDPGIEVLILELERQSNPGGVKADRSSQVRGPKLWDYARYPHLPSDRGQQQRLGLVDAELEARGDPVATSPGSHPSDGSSASIGGFASALAVASCDESVSDAWYESRRFGVLRIERYAEAEVIKRYPESLLSKLAGIRPVDRAMSRDIGRVWAWTEIRFPGHAVQITQGSTLPERR